MEVGQQLYFIREDQHYQVIINTPVTLHISKKSRKKEKSFYRNKRQMTFSSCK